jgi:hypothetical protein
LKLEPGHPDVIPATLLSCPVKISLFCWPCVSIPQP